MSVRGDCAGCDEDMNIHSDIDTAAIAEDIMLEDIDTSFDEPVGFDDFEHTPPPPSSLEREPWRDTHEDF